MSSRSFFDIRYTIPGYVFVLFFIVSYFCNNQLLSLSVELSQSIMLIFIGSPVGFLVSQFWYMLFYHTCWKGTYGRVDIPRIYMNFLHDNFHISKDDKYSIAVLDFLYHQYDNDTLKSHVDRRWDLYNILGSSGIALFLGFFLGSIFRINYSLPINPVNILFQVKWLIVLIGVLFIQIFRVGMNKIAEEHDFMVLTMIQNVVTQRKANEYVFDKSFYAKGDENKLRISNKCNIVLKILGIFKLTKKISRTERTQTFTSEKLEKYKKNNTK